MSPNSESEVESGDEADATGERENDAEQEAIRRAAMAGRARERRAYWQRELAAERWEEFKPEMRRRIAVEQALLDGLEKTKTPTFVLLRTYQRDAVHAPSQPKSERDEEREDLEARIAKAVQRERELNERLRLTPERQPGVRAELVRKIGTERDYIVDLKNKLRMHQS